VEISGKTFEVFKQYAGIQGVAAKNPRSLTHESFRNPH